MNRNEATVRIEKTSEWMSKYSQTYLDETVKAKMAVKVSSLKEPLQKHFNTNQKKLDD